MSGNVSLYNETKNEDGTSLAILPTPAIGGVGLLDDWEKSATIGFKAEGDQLALLYGGSGTRIFRGPSRPVTVVASDCHGRRAGWPPPVRSWSGAAVAGEFIRELIAKG